MAGFRHLAPSGTPIAASDLVHWIATLSSSRRITDDLCHALQRRFGVPHVSVTRTGRAGLTVLLRALARLDDGRRSEVIVPAYTCYSVAASAVKAGLRVRVADVDPETLDYAPAALRQIDAERVLAIVATNLYGLPSDMPALTRWAQERGVFLVDDAAQAMGASISGRASGTWGDAGLFSFDRGKNVSAINGGAVLSHCANVATALATEMRTLGSPRLGAATLDVVGALAYTVLLHPVLYGVPARMPFLGLGKTQFDTDYPLERTSRPLAALALTMLDRLPVLTLARRENAARLDLELRSLPGIQLPQPRPGADPAYLRFPLLMPSRESRDESVMRLTARGIGASGSYPRAIVDVRELQDRLVGDPATPMGRTIADRILTLPTHPYVRAADIRSIREHLESVLRRHERAPRRVAPAVFGQTQ